VSFDHESPVNQTDIWLTPPYIIKALGRFDLDPCTPPVMPWSTASRRYTKADDGLASPWAGRVWMNPPYGRDVILWMRKLAAHGRGTALIFARTETAAFKETVWSAASGVLFLYGRINFCTPDGVQSKNSAGAPSCLVAYGAEDLVALQNSGLNGAFVKLREELGVFA
jgi:hypothetical protein